MPENIGGLDFVRPPMLEMKKVNETKDYKEYEVTTAEAQVRDLDAIVEKLNTTFQEELKQEVEAVNFFLS